jgi:gliding motility-associated-like protein
MKHLLTLCAVWISGTAIGQTSILITDADMPVSAPFDCTPVGNGQNFFDSGNNTADYSANENEVLVVCPDAAGGTKLVATFGTLAGFTWNVDGSDTLYVYDGPTVASPLLGQHNSVTDPGGFTYISSWTNTTGCLTFRFRSDAAVEGTGWDAKIECVAPPQPFEAHMSAYIYGEANGANDLLNDQNPNDTGYIDVCFGDTVMLVANPVFLYDPTSGNTNGGGYDQIGNHTITWDFSDGTQLTGSPVYFVPPARSGFLVTLRVADSYPQIEGLIGKIRVSTVPSFATCRPVDDTLCIGAATELLGGVTLQDTVGVDPTSAGFELGGSFAGVTFLPDGNGNNYNTDIVISGFPVSATFQNASDIQSLCFSVEHSFLGDLEAWLTCPNGTQAVIFNSSTTGTQAIPGGFAGGGVYLGQANDASTAVGVCWEYCFYDAAPNPAWASGFPTTAVTTPSPGTAVTAGDYQPEQSFAALAGCPLNGTWTLTFRDSWAADDGWICEWGITFDPSINPNNEYYTPYIAAEQWLPDPTIVAGGNDTAVIVFPDDLGPNNYTFQVVDNFGCTYDTTITVIALPGPTVMPDTGACDLTHQIINTFAPEGGSWVQLSGPGTTTFTPSASVINPTLTVTDEGLYLYQFTDVQCGLTQDLFILYQPEPTVDIRDTSLCEGESVEFDVTAGIPGVNYSWAPNGEVDSVLVVSTAGVYTVTLSNICGTAIDSAVVTVDPCNLIIPNVFTPNGQGGNENFVVVGLERYETPHLYIYNRWGTLVFEDKDYQNDWNGKDKGGQDLSDGTYLYVLHAFRGEEVKDFSGTVNIFR